MPHVVQLLPPLRRAVRLAALGVVLAAPLRARADAFPPVWLDLLPASAAPSLGRDRVADAYAHLDVEVELPAYRGLMFCTRATPAYFYLQGGHRGIFGLGFGVLGRIYFAGAARAGAYVDLGSGPLWTARNFEGNASRLNFISRVALGYRFPGRPFRVAMALEHTSNAGTAEPNQGVNGLGVVLGLEL